MSATKTKTSSSAALDKADAAIKEAEQHVEAVDQTNKQLADQNQLLRNDNGILRVRVEKFDEILNKIERASLGASLIVRNNSAVMGMEAGYTSMSPMPSLDRNERAERREAELYERIIELTARQQSVHDIVQFAREHKA